MRMSRMRKFKRYKQFVTVWKVSAICYISIFTLGYLASGTGAYFVSTQENEQVIQAGTWWDGSELSFAGKPKVDENACPSGSVTVELKNQGLAMTESTTYEVFFSEKGNPQKSGKKVGSGEISPLEKEEIISLTHTAEKEGFYVFKVVQLPLYEEETNKSPEDWSKKVKVKCKEKKVEETTESKEEQEQKENAPAKEDKKQDEDNSKEKQKKQEQKPEKTPVENSEETQSPEQESEEETNQTESEEQETTKEEPVKEETEKKANVQTSQEQESKESEAEPEEQQKAKEEEEGE